MGNLTGIWIIEHTDPDIGLHDGEDPPRSIFRINDAESEVHEINAIDWGGATYWVLIAADDDLRPHLTKRALVLVDNVPHWAYFGLNPEVESPEILVSVEPVAAGPEPSGVGRGRP